MQRFNFLRAVTRRCAFCSGDHANLFYTLKEAQVLIERWRREYHTVRPHSGLGHRPPAPEAIAVISEILALLCSARISGPIWPQL